MSTELYTGQLFGGPDEGNLVTATTTSVYTEVTTVMWLDGKEPDKAVAIMKTKGTYDWQPQGRFFLWKLEGSSTEIRQPETV